MDVARIVVERTFITDDVLGLRHWRGSWWAWRASRWIEIEDRAVRSLLYRFTEKAVYFAGKEMAPWAPNRRKIGDLVEALAAICLLPADREQPFWLDDRPMGVVVSVANGLLDVERRTLIPHTPLFFNTTSVPFAYEPAAGKPQRWLGFLSGLWPAEPNAIDALANGSDTSFPAASTCTRSC